jgi:uncharacterized protein (DUF433 family)
MFGDTGEAVAFLAEALRNLMQREPTASVALITRYPQQADVYYDALRIAEVPKLRRVGRQDFSFTPGIDVTDVRQVKGLEFDYVVILDPTSPELPRGDRVAPPPPHRCHPRRPPAVADLLRPGQQADPRGRDRGVAFAGMARESKARSKTLKLVLQEHLKRVDYDHGRAVRLFPLHRDHAPRAIVIDPRRAFGRPVLHGTSVPIADISMRFRRGDSIEQLAGDYDVTPAEIEEALRATREAA